MSVEPEEHFPASLDAAQLWTRWREIAAWNAAFAIGVWSAVTFGLTLVVATGLVFQVSLFQPILAIWGLLLWLSFATPFLMAGVLMLEVTALNLSWRTLVAALLFVLWLLIVLPSIGVLRATDLVPFAG